MKPGVPIFVVDSVEKAVKFYTEKLGFDIAELSTGSGAEHVITFGMVRKNRCFIGFRTPGVDELAEFSLIKRCSSRASGLYIHMPRGFDKFYDRCVKKQVMILDEKKMQNWGDQTFSIRDPFGIKLTFGEPIPGFAPPAVQTFLGISVDGKSDESLEKMVSWLKGFGILRRAAKKYAMLWLKQVFDS